MRLKTISSDYSKIYISLSLFTQPNTTIMKKNLLFSIIVMTLLAACNKDKNKEEAAISLQGQWTVENTIVKEYTNGTLTNTETIPSDGTKINFQAGGNLVVSEPGSPDESTPYSIKAGSKVEFYGETYEIRNLTATNVTLFIRRDLSLNDYNEVFINLKR